MPGDANQFGIAVGMDLQQFFGSRDNSDHSTVFQPKPIAMSQPHGLRQIEQQIPPAIGGQQNTATESPVEVDRHLINRHLRAPASRWQDLMRAHQ